MGKQIAALGNSAFLAPVCSCVPDSLYMVHGHMATIWAGPGMSEHCDWVIFGGPQVALTPSAASERREDRRLTVITS